MSRISSEMTAMVHEHACRLLRQDGESTSVTGRNRCTAEDFRGVPGADIST